MSEENNNRYFVWVAGVGNIPAYQIWNDGLTNLNGKTLPHLQHHKLEGEDHNLTLDELAVKYPIKGNHPIKRNMG